MRAVAAASPPPLLHSISRSHAGRRRAHNEDRVLERPDLGLWAVADGMGGHRNGGEAATRLLAALEAPFHPRAATGFRKLDELEQRTARINAELYDARAVQGPSGATLVALVVHEAHAACVWAGDSRAYLLRAGALTRLTRDHSVVQELVDAGALDERRRAVHPDAHRITRAVGAAPTLELERRFLPVEPGDVFLLCSDGLTSCVEDREVAELLDGALLAAAADALMARALSEGAPDNVSLVLASASDGPPLRHADVPTRR